MKDPTECYNQARELQVCYNTKAYILNDAVWK